MDEFIHPIEEAETPDDQLSDEERQKRKNEHLLDACEANELDKAFQALDDGAEAIFEDDKKWSPLSWASLHGNLPLIRTLLAANAAQPYGAATKGFAAVEGKPSAPDPVLKEMSMGPYRAFQQPEEQCEKYTPLHWAAYKGHPKVVWLLLKQGFSPEAVDLLGNTVLHQAVAGGCLSVVKTILSCGANVHAENRRGHTALELATDDDVKRILRAAINATRCGVTGEYFSHRVPRYMCSFTENFFARNAVQFFWRYDTPEAEEKEKPVTWCDQVHQAVESAEERLMEALQTECLGELDRALQGAANLPVCPKLQQQINNKMLKLEGELALRRAANLPEVLAKEDLQQNMNTLMDALNTAEIREINDEHYNYAKRQLRRLEVEIALGQLLKKPSYESFTPNPTFNQALAGTIEAAEGLFVSPPLLLEATQTRNRMEKHLVLKARSHAVEEVSNVRDFFELKSGRKALLPDWSKDATKLEEVVIAFREEVAAARAAGVNEELICFAESARLKPLESLLIEMKRRDEERLMKKARKKSVKKKASKK